NGLADAREPYAAGIREVHGIGTSIARGIASGRETLPLQLVYEIHHRGLVDLEHLDQLLLTQGAARVQQPEHAEVPDVQRQRAKGVVEGRAQTAMRALEEESGF